MTKFQEKQIKYILCSILWSVWVLIAHFRSHMTPVSQGSKKIFLP